MLIETHVLEVKSPNTPTKYLGFGSEETARGAAFDALQTGVFRYEEYSYVEEFSVSKQISVVQGTEFRVISRDVFMLERMFNG